MAAAWVRFRREAALLIVAVIGIVWLMVGWRMEEPTPMIIGFLFISPVLFAAIPLVLRLIPHKKVEPKKPAEGAEGEEGPEAEEEKGPAPKRRK